MNRWQKLASAAILSWAVSVDGPGSAAAQTKPEGEMRFALYVTLAPAWLDPGEAVLGNLTPFWMPNSRVCSKSIASMMSALSLAFLPTVLRNCWTGWIACSSSTVRQPCRFVVVKSPYTRLTLAVPSDATSERISPITAADALSASMRTARRRESDNKQLSAVLEQVKAQQAAYPARQQRGHVVRQRPPNNLEAPGLPSKGRAPRRVAAAAPA